MSALESAPSAERLALRRALLDAAAASDDPERDHDARVAARVVEDLAKLIAPYNPERKPLSVQTIYDIFGAPGYWGYETPLGDALIKLYRAPAEVAS